MYSYFFLWPKNFFCQRGAMAQWPPKYATEWISSMGTLTWWIHHMGGSPTWVDPWHRWIPNKGGRSWPSNLMNEPRIAQLVTLQKIRRTPKIDGHSFNKDEPSTWMDLRHRIDDPPHRCTIIDMPEQTRVDFDKREPRYIIIIGSSISRHNLFDLPLNLPFSEHI